MLPVLRLDGCFFLCLHLTFVSSGLMVVTGVSSNFFFSSGQDTCVLALISCRKAVYIFFHSDGGSGDKHSIFSVCCKISWHLAFSSSRVTVF